MYDVIHFLRVQDLGFFEGFQEFESTAQEELHVEGFGWNEHEKQNMTHVLGRRTLKIQPGYNLYKYIYISLSLSLSPYCYGHTVALLPLSPIT